MVTYEQRQQLRRMIDAEARRRVAQHRRRTSRGFTGLAGRAHEAAGGDGELAIILAFRALETGLVSSR